MLMEINSVDHAVYVGVRFNYRTLPEVNCDARIAVYLV